MATKKDKNEQAAPMEYERVQMPNLRYEQAVKAEEEKQEPTTAKQEK